MIYILTKYNKGYSWYIQNYAYVKGYYFDNKNNYFEGINFATNIDQIKSKNDFETVINSANGIFSIIYTDGNKCFAAVDIVRTFPLFYCKIGSDFYISDSIELLIIQKKEIKKNLNGINDILLAGYVTGSETLIEEIYQLRGGEILYIENNNLSTCFYHTYINTEITNDNFDISQKKLDVALQNIFERLTIAIKNQPVFIPLSGGYDSRLIAMMLKEHGIKNIMCFTYGRKYNNPEIDISRQVAKKLGLDWMYIEYTDKLIDNYLTSDFFKDYFPFSANYVSMFFMQEFFAVKYLLDNKYLDDNPVFIPGHSGDFIAGSHISDIKEICSKKYLSHKIIEKNFTLSKIKLEKYLIKDRISDQLTNKDKYSFIDYENWDLIERQAKYIVNSANIYNHAGCKQALPLWDKELVDFFARTPYYYKKYNLLYRTLLESYFKKHNILFLNELQADKKHITIQRFKNRVKKFFPISYIKKKLIENDWVFYNNITQIMLEDMKKRNKPINTNYKRYGNIIIQWYLSKIF